ncbi:uncharacterized protein LOC103316594 [Nasonia vitripennis]|uniref:Uncharacterized protein n=1 Tax=Nasonia vitripennis TaxID=7425 RepID=A0A7M7HBT1_NASVI|nr:uncharacterized protein LOC103316594 [Nasonia vitripennis]
MEKSFLCPQRHVIPHGAKVFVTAFLLASHLRPRKPEKKCKPNDEKIPNDRGLMEHCWKLVPYKYNLSPDPPASSLELLMMQSRREYEKVHPPKIPEPELNGKIHYDYGKIFKRIKL